MAQLSLATFFDLVARHARGELTFGSRTPVKDTPAWVTLDVVTGGFATGGFSAGGALLDHERLLARELGIDSDDVTAPEDVRERINTALVSAAHLPRLQAWLDDGGFAIDVPEEGALLVVAWLLRSGRVDEARVLVETIAPWFSRLRFYPRPTSRQSTGASVSRRAVGDVVTALQTMTTPSAITTMRESFTALVPFADRLEAAVLATATRTPIGVFDDLASTHIDGIAIDDAITALVPLTIDSDDVVAEARAVLALAKTLPARRRDQNRERLLAVLAIAAGADSDDASVRGRGRVALQAVLRRRRRHDHVAVRAAQAAQLAQPTVVDVAHVAAQRLRPLPNDGGIDVAVFDAFVAPVGVAEATARVVAGTVLPDNVVARIELALEAPVATLLERGLVPSAEVLGTLIPALTAVARSAAIEAPVPRRLYVALYQAFRRRRSLLLVNLASQVKLGELPWVKALEPDRRRVSSSSMNAETLATIAETTLRHFPATLVPNPLVRELSTLSQAIAVSSTPLAAAHPLPFHEELAADIFMGTFTPKFIDAARRAAQLLRGTVYARYFDLPIDDVLALSVSTSKPTSRLPSWARPRADDDPAMATFAALCAQRAEREASSSTATTKTTSWVAKNGSVIEQQQILTSHNLASLWSLSSSSSSSSTSASVLDADALALACFEATCAWWARPAPTNHARLIARKNAAIAWRHLLFFVSVSSRPNAATTLLTAATPVWAALTSTVQTQWRPYWRGLVHVLGEGGRFDTHGRVGDA
ncbi:MAG TPA: hypothetical protein VGF99_17420, partial [Myxococcota bacterium]